MSSLYEKYHSSRDDERLGAFEQVVREFHPRRALYPGCFVHVTPSFVVPNVTYVDMDRRAARFFASGEAAEIVQNHKQYDENAEIAFLHQSYQEPFGVEPCDLLVSQYGGFVSEACWAHLRPGGVLLANNSHGDAAVAQCNPAFELVAVITRRGERFSLTQKNLDHYFVPKKELPNDVSARRKHLLELGRGVAYTKSAWAYVFRRRE